jgi:hypothetical protein
VDPVEKQKTQTQLGLVQAMKNSYCGVLHSSNENPKCDPVMVGLG